MQTVKAKVNTTHQKVSNNVRLLKNNQNFIRATSENKTKMLYSMIAITLAYNCAPIPSDTDIVVGQFFASSISPDWNDCLARMNEEDIINFEQVGSLAKRLYMARYDQAHGLKHIKHIIDGVCDSSFLNETDRCYLECLEDAFE